jgi:hypothetical protein
MVLFGVLKDNLLTNRRQLHYRKYRLLAVMLFLSGAFTCCTPETKEKTKDTVQQPVAKRVTAPSFHADSAYFFIKKQADFGPRVPGTAAHAACATYLADQLKSYGLETMIQKGAVKTFDGKTFGLKNIIASYKPELKNRILICAHWDTRPWADEDEREGYADKPSDGANDGASGVGVALEIARQLQFSAPLIGIDFLFFDLEDYGDPEGDGKSWCLGSQYWAKNMHKPDYYANFGILLDMVGRANATFAKEEQSVSFASAVVNKIWKTAEQKGYSAFFVPEIRSHVGTDDHLFVNQAGIPCVNIIEYDHKAGGFGDYHHTQRDNMQLIDKTTLKAVGQTLLEVIYNEK